MRSLSDTAEALRPCPRCGAFSYRTHRVLHHLPCAYVGPDYDFNLDETGAGHCPKCLHPVGTGHKNWEEIGRSLRCDACVFEDVEDRTPDAND